MKKFSDFIKINMKNYEVSSDSVEDFEFELKFELGQIDSIKKKNTDL